MKRVGLLLVVLLGLGVVALWSPWGRGTLIACLVLEDLLQPEGTSFLAKWSPPITRETRGFSGPDGLREADLYLLPTAPLPDGRQARRAGVLLLHGVVDTGKDDPRLIKLARTLARAGFAVWVPEIPSMKALKVQPEDVEEVTAAFRALEALEGVDRKRLGIIAFSYGAGPALIAASHLELRERVRFLLSFGGYFDLETVLVYTTTGYFEAGGQQYVLSPEEYGKWAFLRTNAELL
ncbi:MAG: hypothetical protein HZA23_03560, partial [Nitrospirae bacterium]|nr:hypothetical protein [Nitrospirota bacterium]